MTETLTAPQSLDERPAQDLGTLSFKVTPEFKKEFKIYAASRGITMIDLLKEGFALSKAIQRPH